MYRGAFTISFWLWKLTWNFDVALIAQSFFCLGHIFNTTKIKNLFLNKNIFKECINPSIVDITKNIYDIEGGIKVKVEYVINEQIGEFIERGN